MRTRAGVVAGDGASKCDRRVGQPECRSHVEGEQPDFERFRQCGQPCAVGFDVDIRDGYSSFGRGRIAGDRREPAVVRNRLQGARCTVPSGVDRGIDSTSAGDASRTRAGQSGS